MKGAASLPFDDPRAGVAHLLLSMLRVALIGLLVMLTVTVAAWSRVPDRIAMHLNTSGVADRFADKTLGLFAFPVIVTIALTLMSALVVAESYRKNLRNSARVISATWLATVAVLCLTHGAIVFYAISSIIPGDAVTAICLGTVSSVVGYFLPKARKNWVFGVRTQWTMASELSWSRTHRLGGVLFLGFGMFLIFGGLATVDYILVLAVVGITGLTVFLTVYSWWIGRSDRC